MECNTTGETGQFYGFYKQDNQKFVVKKLEFITRDKRSRDMSVSLEELEAVLPDERCVKDITGEELGSTISRFLRGQKAEARNVFIRKYYFLTPLRKSRQDTHLLKAK